MTKTHTHEYYQHPNEGWQSHMACSVCGFACPISALAIYRPELMRVGPVMPTLVFNERKVALR